MQDSHIHPVMRQALAPFTPPRPSINDDDAYIIDIRSRQIVRHVGAMRDWSSDKVPLSIGQAFVSGLQAKGLL